MSLNLKFLPTTHNGRVLAATAAFILCWTIGLNLPHRADDAYLNHGPASTKPGPPSPLHRGKSHGPAPSGLETRPDETDDFCSHFHLELHDLTTIHADGQVIQSPPRKIYDLLLINPETSLDALELHLSQMSPSVDFFVLLESPTIKPPPDEQAPEPQWWERGLSKLTEPSPSLGSDDADSDTQPILDSITGTILAPYNNKIIRRSLSQSSSDFAPGMDHQAAARNAVYSQVVPLLTGSQKAAVGDVLLVSDVEELVRPDTMKVLRNCHIPERMTIRTRKYWYSFQWFKIEKRKDPARESKENYNDEDPPRDKEQKREEDFDGATPEWWPHPQATLYQGPETILPNDLRKQRGEDYYVFGNGGWTCQLCYGMIADTLVKAGQHGLIWHDGPHWKAAGRIVDRVRRGVDLFDRANLSRIEFNPDIPSYLQDNTHRFPWMLNRNPLDANFKDFDEAEYAQFISRKKEVDSEKDTEAESEPGKVWNLATTQADNDPEFAPANQPGFGELDRLPPLKLPPQPQMSETDKAFLKKLKEKPESTMTGMETALLEQLSRGDDASLLPPLVYGED
ncbi:glycosyltransferase family 17 [Diaporthe helianthi]|uniref:Glycosyltransferase family 17 n=1 Tax=Diaporthe helianthi TaxID=158607 RepID=A0A2P5I8A4_DIAHE|nr:glycosyltransferase family 17 [Diaporthe helianthi]